MLVLIPSYEPDENLIKVITEIKVNTNYNILVVDDGSGEKYSSLFQTAEGLGCTVLHHKENRGKGAALKTGFEFILIHYAGEGIICADSDGQHRLEDIIRVAESINEDKYEMILGVRQFEGKVPLKSRIGNSLTAFLFSSLTRMNIRDTQTGLRGYPYSMIVWLLSVDGSRFEYEFNLLLKAGEAGTTTRQIPIKTVYENNNKGTHFHPLKDSVSVYLPLFKFSFSSFAAAILDFILLFFFQSLTGSLFLGVVYARAVSSIFNYMMNKVLVFNARNISHIQSAPKYFSLVIVIMFLNYCLLSVLSKYLLVPQVLAKILTELILFVLSYTVQNKLIFFRKRKEEYQVS